MTTELLNTHPIQMSNRGQLSIQTESGPFHQRSPLANFKARWHNFSLNAAIIVPNNSIV
jgi:hypothetical protein